MKSDIDAEMERIEIERGKALFLSDYQRLERGLEKQFMDPAIGFNERLAIQDKLMSLKYRWQESGIRNLDIVIAMRDEILDILKAAGGMGLTPDTMDETFRDARKQLAELNKIIAEAKAKGLA